MAETFLTPVIHKLLGLVVKEAKSLKGVHGDLRSLKDELEIIQPLLKDAEARLEKCDIGDALKAWVKQVREEASRIEEVIDEYFYHVEQHRKHQSGSIMGPLYKAGHFIKTLKPRQEIACEIKSIKRSLSEIKGRAQGYGLRPLEEGPSGKATNVEAHDPRLRSLFIEKDELVGIESTTKELVRRLAEGPSIRLVISLVGEGGIGKTTLAKNVYDNDVVKHCFRSANAWITVSRPYNLQNLLKNMKRQLYKAGDDDILGDSDTIEELINYLRKYLRAKRYVIVFDDVWQENFWEDIKLALPNNDQGSRIIITTRNAEVANFCKETPHDVIQKMEPWSPMLAWELFCKRAFRFEFEGICPVELRKLSFKIVSKCQGLPLVVVAIASLLATKEKVVFQWHKVLNDLNSKVEMNSQFITRIHKILSLSYYDLPYSLRYCFLYFGVFPENYPIYDEMLYRLWIVEGFVKARRGKTAEEVAEEYLKELVQRNLVTRDLWRPVGIGQGTGFQVHDLMRDVILLKADDVCFSQIWDEKSSNSRGKGRRLTIYGGTENVLKNVESSGVRSVFFFDINDQLTQFSVASLFKKFKLLEVLDFGNLPIDTLPKELGNLFHLKYLSLNSTNIKMLPKSISRLQNLESVDIRDTLIRELPNEINKLKKLRHLLAYSYNYEASDSIDFVRGVTIQEGFGDLLDLQTLTFLEANDLGRMKELEKLRKLRWLGISKVTTETGRALSASFSKMDQLERLVITSIDENEVLDIELHNSSSPHFLRELILTGLLEKLPRWISELQNLRGLSLKFSKLIDEPINYLKGLPNLETLQLLNHAYEGEQLQFEEGSFQKLQTLFLFGLVRLRVVKIDRGALPLLEQLNIVGCLLLEVPSIQHLTNMKGALFNGIHLL
ncbi:NB-ARC domain, LRR domain containing protein [Parasponia andersonii]|uniref:NB-ARC domain, LRR domain containing protein n=1 Tax=Parasponia andersonii TaxID=3476 RepID=A0A2P5DYH8_PARAD|nr:NB-ARC domain, LRR domain containing protein [Parasponia andersonii]